MDRAELPSLGFLNAAGAGQSFNNRDLGARLHCCGDCRELVSRATARDASAGRSPAEESSRQRISDTLQELRRRLIDERLQREALARGQHVVRNSETITGYEMLLLPVVRALDNPDADGPLREKLRTGLKELLGSWRLGYLAICDEPKTALDRYPVQPRNIDEGSTSLRAYFPRKGWTIRFRSAGYPNKVEQVLKNLEADGLTYYALYGHHRHRGVWGICRPTGAQWKQSGQNSCWWCTATACRRAHVAIKRRPTARIISGGHSV